MNEIGEILKEARIEQGYTLDDLQQTTKIQKRYLQAIEDGNVDILPGRFTHVHLLNNMRISLV